MDVGERKRTKLVSRRELQYGRHGVAGCEIQAIDGFRRFAT